MATAPNAPRYRQVADALQRRIAAGEPGFSIRLPSERAIAEEFGLSRMTARQAVELLARRGAVYRRPGSGTFVASARIVHTLQRLAGFSEQMRAQGVEPSGRVLDVSLREAPSERVRAALRLAPRAGAWRVRRIRFGDGEPLLLETFHVPAERFPGLDRLDLDQSSLYDLMVERYGVEPVSAHEAIEPTACEAADARHLATRPGAPAILVERTTYDGDGVPVEYARDLYRGDRARFEIDLRS
jgi:GntR family transcriptional regulator